MSCRSWKIYKIYLLLPKKGLILLYRPIILVTHHSKKKLLIFYSSCIQKNIWPSLLFSFFQNRERPLLLPLTCTGTGFPEGIVDKMGYC